MTAMKKLLPIFLILALLMGCGTTPEETHSTLPTETTLPAPSETEETSEPSTEPSTEPPLILDPGPDVYVNGILLGGTAMDGETLYVIANIFCVAMGGTMNPDGTASFTCGEDTLTFSPEYSHIMRGNKATVLNSPILNYNGEAYLPLEELCQMAELSVYTDPEYATVYCTSAAWPREVPEGYDVPVFMYHAVSNDTWGIDELFVMPERMEEQLKYLTENGYDPIFFEDLYHIEDYDKPVILTFDDGYEDNYTELFPLLKKYNVKATIFIITGFTNQPNYMTQDQIKEMADSGLVSIQSHTFSHPDLDELSLEQQEKELADSKLHVTRITRREPYVLCYPTGKYNTDTLTALEGLYAFGIKMRGGLYDTSDDPYLINRYYVAREDTIYWFKGVLEDIFD